MVTVIAPLLEPYFNCKREPRNTSPRNTQKESKEGFQSMLDVEIEKLKEELR